jgi:hypothetical protein
MRMATDASIILTYLRYVFGNMLPRYLLVVAVVVIVVVAVVVVMEYRSCFKTYKIIFRNPKFIMAASRYSITGECECRIVIITWSVDPGDTELL